MWREGEKVGVGVRVRESRFRRLTQRTGRMEMEGGTRRVRVCACVCVCVNE